VEAAFFPVDPGASGVSNNCYRSPSFASFIVIHTSAEIDPINQSSLKKRLAVAAWAEDRVNIQNI
jgi:hypothetical protein